MRFNRALSVGLSLPAVLPYIGTSLASSHGTHHITQRVLNSEARLAHTKKVAIIGAGSGGSSSAYYLRKFAGSQSEQVEITVYEKNSYIGGRSTTVNVYGEPSEPVELGGSIFVSVNHVLMNASLEFGLKFRDYKVGSEDGEDTIGVWDGTDFVFTQPGKPTWWSNIKIIWKYGLTPIRTLQLMKSTVQKFLNLYIAPTFPFRDLTQAVIELDLLNATSHTGEQFLQHNGVWSKFSTDLVQASTRVNYAQNLGGIHGLETMVSLAAEGAVQIEGGNWQIFQGMLNSSKADVHLNTEVTKLSKNENGKWTVWSRSAAPHTGAQGNLDNVKLASTEAEFDIVILASPYQFAGLEIDPPLKQTPDEIPYVKLHVTLFTSSATLSPNYFGLPDGSAIPETILTTLNATEQQDESIRRGVGKDGVGNAGFYSISTIRKVQRPVNGGHTIENLYKVFSAEEFTDDKIGSILGLTPKDVEAGAITWAYRKIWHSYPVLNPRVTFEDIILDGDNESLFYTSGIESFISTMETSGLMGMNVAQLVVNSWKKKRHHTIKDEL